MKQCSVRFSHGTVFYTFKASFDKDTVICSWKTQDWRKNICIYHLFETWKIHPNVCYHLGIILHDSFALFCKCIFHLLHEQKQKKGKLCSEIYFPLRIWRFQINKSTLTLTCSPSRFIGFSAAFSWLQFLFYIPTFTFPLT